MAKTSERFVNLRVHSAYSLLEGAVRIKQMPGLCRANGMPAVAITDSGNLFGALEFSETLADEGIQPIIGCALPLLYETASDPLQAATRAVNAPLPIAPIVLLAQNQIGYGNLMRLSSHAYLDNDGADPHVTMAMLADHCEGLICLTGGAFGPVGRLLRDGRRDAGLALLQQLAALFTGRTYV